MKYYSGLFITTLKEALTYKVNFLFSFLVNIVPLVGYLLLVHFIYAADKMIAGYSYQEAVTYYIFVTFFADLFYPVSWMDIEDNIREGTLNYHIIKPYSYFWHHFTQFYTLKLLYYIVSAVVMLVVTVFVWNKIALPVHSQTIVLFFITLILSAIMAFQLTFVFSISSFWLINNSFMGNLLSVMFPFLMGTILPLDAYPRFAQIIFNTLPFTYLLFLPAKIFLEKYSMALIYQSFAIMLAWILFLTFCIKVLWCKGLIKYEANG
jgi:ABC-2 type transport system permease protein